MQFTFTRGLAAALTSITVAALGSVGWAQGSDNCATAQAIGGVGSYAFNTTSATTGTQGQSNANCNFFSQIGINKDVWFTWVAPTTATYEVSTCGGASFDTKIAVYDGSGCPVAAAIACNDDACGVQSTVSFTTTGGNSYTIQLGQFGAGAGGSGTFSIAVGVPCTGGSGPDVIVGSITDVLNTTAIGGIDAIALGTESCNLGTAVVNWISNTTAHPVIRQNAYRFKVVGGAGRFEQVGLSWLKHAFTSLQDSLCCACQGGGDGSHLGIGCSDPYGAGLNGGQAGAGPNWQVNAHTGAFTYPPANPSWSGGIARRCQIAVSDLEVTGGVGAARYFGEGQYVTADDALAGNQNNNASWNEMSVTSSAGEFSAALLGPTHRTEPAIRTWPSLETGVTLTDIQVAGDGLIVLGSKTTNLGGGQFHYEYAVYNMNSDRNVGSFSVPVQAGVTVTNIGFHDVNYHDGDGNGSTTFSGTDWVGSVGGGAVSWSTESQAVNANANAIRWGSLYNFRFDANAAPIGGVITLGMWKPGSPASVTGAGDVPGGSAFSTFCAGDGSVVPCPCVNNGTTGHGCANSSFAAGSLLAGSGTASVTSDTAVLTASNMTGATCVFFQGTAQMAPVVVDDGLGCVTGTVVRLGTKAIAANTSSYPQGADQLIHIRGSIPGAGGTRYYQCFYRNASATFCPPATSNRTNGVAITWVP